MARSRLLNFIGALCFGVFYCKTQTIINNVQDAIQIATDFLKGVSYGLKKLDEGLKSADDVLQEAGNDKCEFLCPKGETPRKRENHRPKPNGCGAYGVQVSSQELPVGEMTSCCNQHDICYGTCQMDKDRCDQDFEKCLLKACEKQKKRLAKDAFSSCKGTAKILYLSTMALGCKAFKDAQLEACWCPKTTEL